ncbi:MAG: hypothetical protein ABIW50_06955 [Candidatus Limnocylindria bacterium]
MRARLVPHTGCAVAPTPVAQILAPLSPGTTTRRAGRSTGLTTARFSIQTNEAADLQAAEASLNALLDDLGA